MAHEEEDDAVDPIRPDSFPVGLVRLDAADRVLDVNTWFAEWIGRSRADLVGTAINDLFRPVREDLIPAEGATAPIMVRHPDRPDRAAIVSRAVDADGATLTVLDSTERYRALRELRRSHALADRTSTRLQLVIDASIAFASATTDQRLVEVLADTAARAYDAEQSVVLLLDDDGALRVAAGVNPFAEFIDMELAATFTRGLVDIIEVSGIEEADAMSPMLGQAMRATGVEAIIVAPLDYEGETYGILGCFFRHPRTFDQEAAPLAEALAGQAAQTLVALRMRDRLEYAATHDETTGLPNRRLLEERTREQLIGDGRGRAVIFLDLDGFKAVNDNLGHPVGDEVLREVGRRLQATVREGDIVARYGGDEFLVVCGIADRADACEVAERLRASVRAPIDFLPDGLVLGASVGVALAPAGDQGSPLDHAIRAADHAMYIAKGRGGNRVVDDAAVEPYLIMRFSDRRDDGRGGGPSRSSAGDGR